MIFIIAIGIVLLIMLRTAIPNTHTNAIELGGEWFLNNQNENFLQYEYNFKTMQHSNKSHTLREMGALWSLTELGIFLKDDRYTKLAQKGFAHFEKEFVYDSGTDSITYQGETNIKLGYSAFLVLSLLNLEHQEKEEHLRKLGNGILSLQQPSGELKTFFYSDRTTGKDYYPGEALLALMELYEHTKEERYLQAVQKASPFYQAYFEVNPSTAFIPWQTRAHAKLYTATQDPLAAEFIFTMNDYMLLRHKPTTPCRNFTFKGITTAVYIEGVNQAYALAKERNDQHRTLCYRNFIEEGIAHLLTLQLTNAPQSSPAQGGFKGSPTSNTLRVDRNQHAVMALMDAKELGAI